MTDRLGKISESLARSIRADVTSEVAAVKQAGDKDRETQELILVQRLNNGRKDRLTQLVTINLPATEYNNLAAILLLRPI